MKKIIYLLCLYLVSCNAKNKIETYKHTQTLYVTCQKLQFYSKPFSNESADLIYETKNGDEFQTENILYSPELKKTSLEVNLPTGKKGYIDLSSNPYGNGHFSLNETLNINGKKTNILNNDMRYTLSASKEDPKDIYSLPDDSTDVVVELTNDVRVDSTLITEDYKWIYVISETFSGWAKTDYVSRDIGGPVIWSPDEQVNEELLWADYR